MTRGVTRGVAPLAAALALICLGARQVNPAPDGAAATVASAHAGSNGAALLFACPPVAAAAVAAGRRVFTGAGNCYTCHGPDAKGTPLAPDLHAHKWLNVSGSYESIDSVVTAGVAHPREHPAPMPPKGGANLSASQVCDVSAYVYSLSHPSAAAGASKPSS